MQTGSANSQDLLAHFASGHDNDHQYLASLGGDQLHMFIFGIFRMRSSHNGDPLGLMSKD